MQVSRSPFDPDFAALPQVIPIFPLSGVLLLPGGKMPLNVFEPRYLAMVSDAIAGARVIGLIQPMKHEPGDEQMPTATATGEPVPAGAGSVGDDAAVYPMGCAGRITQFSETEDGRYLVTLSGLCRFAVIKELPLHRGYRRVIPGWTRFEADMAEAPAPVAIDRDRMVRALKSYFKLNEINANWEAIRDTPNDRLVTSLAMICPFAPSEKQALLECPDAGERARVLTALMEMALLGSRRGSDSARH
ncbi:MAG: LON peptidase substrate-binding domain-containing protein [Alphaproteobacteria bacterium]|nr:LON peptidase substrate-binding domain-containing protein [Alphaproteobacteria bacterium]